MENNLYCVKVSKVVDGSSLIRGQLWWEGKYFSIKNILGFNSTDGKENPDNPINPERKSMEGALRMYDCIQIRMINPTQKKR